MVSGAISQNQHQVSRRRVRLQEGTGVQTPPWNLIFFFLPGILVTTFPEGAVGNHVFTHRKSKSGGMDITIVYMLLMDY